MKPECEAAVRAAAGSAKLTKADVDGVQERIVGAMRSLRRGDPQAWAGMGTAGRYQAAAKLARERYLEGTSEAHQRTIQRAAIVARNTARVEAIKPGVKGRLAALDADRFLRDGESGGNTSYEKDTEAQFKVLWDRLQHDHGAVLEDPRTQAALADELHGKDSGDAVVKAAARDVRKQLDLAETLQQRAGILGHGIENYVPQPREWSLMGKPEEWIAKQLERTKLDEYMRADGAPMSHAEIEKFLAESHLSLATNGANKRAGETQGFGGGIGQRGPRQIHYKDGASWLAEMHDYSAHTNIKHILSSYFQGVSKDLTVAGRDGHMADTDVPALATAAHAADKKAELGNPKAQAKLDRMLHEFLGKYEATRRGSAPGNAHWANISYNGRAIVSSSMLGGLFGAFVDPAMAGTYLNAIRVNLRDYAHGLLRGVSPTKANRARLVDMGAYLDSALTAARRTGETTLGRGMGDWLNHAVHGLSLLRMLDRMGASGIAEGGLNKIGRMLSSEKITDLRPADQDYLARKGVTQDHWDVWRAAELDTAGGRTMLTPKAIGDIPEEKLAPIVARSGGKPTAAAIASLRNESMVKLVSGVLTDMQMAGRGFTGPTLTHQWQQHLLQNPTGTIMGEALRWGLLARQVPFGIAKTHLLDVPRRFDSRVARAVYRAKFLTFMTLFGAANLQLKALVRGDDPEDMTKLGFWGKAACAGALGPYGEMMFSTSSEHDNSELVKAMGPGATMADDAMKLLAEAKGKAWDEYVEGKPPATSEAYPQSLLRFARNYAAPLSRLWYVKAAFNHALYQHAQDGIQPGYSDRVRQRMQKDGASSWWHPGDAAPSRAPAMQTAVGQPATD